MSDEHAFDSIRLHRGRGNPGQHLGCTRGGGEMKFWGEVVQLLFIVAALLSVAFVMMSGAMAALNAIMGM